MEKVILTGLATETLNDKTKIIDELPTIDVVKLINEEDKTVAFAVEKELPNIAKAVDAVVLAIKNGGRLIYVGAGTSGRLGILDAVECYPTYGTEKVIGKIAGGDSAFIKAVEGAEDSMELCENDLKDLDLQSNDIVCGIAASGRTPYVIGGLAYAKSVGAKTIAFSCNKDAEISKLGDIVIEVVVGSEVVAGSTRMKAGTSQKLVCNMISTASMIMLGKVYGNLLVDMIPTNKKLVERSIGIVKSATDCTREVAQKALEECEYKCKVAILMVLLDIDAKTATSKLEDNHGYLKKALK